MRFVIQCVLAENTDENRMALRPTHLRFMEVNKDRIFCGGPTVNLDGQPEMMLIILDAFDLGSAEAFIQAEPYNHAGVFERVTSANGDKSCQKLNPVRCCVKSSTPKIYTSKLSRSPQRRS